VLGPSRTGRTSEEVTTGIYKPKSRPAFLFEDETAPSVIRGWHRAAGAASAQPNQVRMCQLFLPAQSGALTNVDGVGVLSQTGDGHGLNSTCAAS